MKPQLRLLFTVSLVLCAIFVAFAIRPVAPGDPTVSIYSRQVTQEPPTPLILPITPSQVGPVRSTDEVDCLYQIGTTFTDFFSYGAYNRFLQRDALGGMHASWMNHQSANGARTVNYAAYDTSDTPIWWNYGSAIDLGAGFNQMEILSSGIAVIGAHHSVAATATRPGGYVSTVASDCDYQAAGFFLANIPNPTTLPTDSINWPSIAVDRNDVVHVFARDKDGGRNIPYNRVFYSRTDNMQGNPTNFSYAFRCFQPSYALAASRISNKVAVSWPQTAIPDGYTDLHGWTGFLVSEYNNDLWIAQSTDGGASWNFDDAVHNNITKFRVWSEERFAQSDHLDTLWAAGDTFRFINTSAMVYDNNDNLHIIFNVCRFVEDLTVDTAGIRPRVPPVKRVGLMPTFLYHWTDAHPDTFSVVADGWWWPVTLDNRTPPRWRQEFRTTIDRMSISVATDNELYCAYTMYGNPVSHIDTSANGYPCGNVWVTHSVDNGTTWYHPTPITDTTNNRGAASGTAHSRIWPSLPETIDNDSLYIMYFDDRSGGSAWVDGGQDGSTITNDWTLNQVYVQTVARSAIRTDSTLHYPDYPGLRCSYRFDPNAPILRLTAPTAGLYLDNPIQFNWLFRQIDSTARVNIELNRDYPDGAWELIDNVPITTRTYNWTFEEEYNLLRMRFRISLASNPTVVDVLSDDNAPRDSLLQTLRLVSPTALYLTNPIILQWDYFDVAGTRIRNTDSVRIEVNRNFPDGAWTILRDVPITNDTVQWRWDPSFENANVRFRISLLRDPTLSDVSQHLYYIVAGVNDPVNPVISQYSLHPAYPNPFNPYTTIRFAIPFRERVTVKVYDIAGREIATLADNIYNAGEQRITWRPYRLSSGVYFVKMTAGRYSATQKVVFMK